MLYLANGLLNQIDRLPLLPSFLQLVGLAFSSWFAFRCAWGLPLLELLAHSTHLR